MRIQEFFVGGERLVKETIYIAPHLFLSEAYLSSMATIGARWQFTRSTH